MDIQPQNVKPISDDQELAKVLAGITQQPSNDLEATAPAPNPAPMPTPMPEPTPPPIMAQPVVGYNPPTDNMSQPNSSNAELEAIRKDALLELRPLVDKLDLMADEKFNIYLLLLRSTDDKTLIAPAHKAATEITDDTKRAQALLDIIKEIDFLSSPV